MRGFGQQNKLDSPRRFRTGVSGVPVQPQFGRGADVKKYGRRWSSPALTIGVGSVQSSKAMQLDLLGAALRDEDKGGGEERVLGFEYGRDGEFPGLL